MKTPDKYLVTKLAAVLMIKLALLGGLWWGFVRDQRVTVNASQVADQVLSSRLNSAIGDAP